jgi:hypothetical protein
MVEPNRKTNSTTAKNFPGLVLRAETARSVQHLINYNQGLGHAIRGERRGAQYITPGIWVRPELATKSNAISSALTTPTSISLCVCVCVCERERERDLRNNSGANKETVI